MYVSPEEAPSVLRSGDKVFIHTAAAAPKLLIEALTERGKSLKDIHIYQLHTEREQDSNL